MKEGDVCRNPRGIKRTKALGRAGRRDRVTECWWGEASAIGGLGVVGARTSPVPGLFPSCLRPCQIGRVGGWSFLLVVACLFKGAPLGLFISSLFPCSTTDDQILFLRWESEMTFSACFSGAQHRCLRNKFCLATPEKPRH